MRNQSNQWLIPVVLALGAAAALWYYWTGISAPQPEPVAVPQPVTEEPAELPEPLHPVDATEGSATAGQELVPLPPLDESDEYLKMAIADIFGGSIDDMLAESGMIERVVATIDSLPRSHVAERIRPINRLEGLFLVDGQDSSGEYSINIENYRRYDALVGLATSADLAEVAELYRRFYPLFQGAYVDLGYPDGYFNDRLVEVIDDLLATPDSIDPIALVRPHVLYEYEDAELEALSSGQKLMLRMGREHAASIRVVLRDLRERITAL